MKKIKYTEIQLAGNKNAFKGNYGAKGFALTFVYSNKGNFLIKGFWGETEAYLDKLVQDGLKFYYQYSFYKDGKKRFTYTNFWKRSVSVLAPEKDTWGNRHRNKFVIKKLNKYGHWETILEFKRLPKRWIPEFEKI